MVDRFRRLQQRLGTDFRAPQLLIQAVTHRSYCNEDPTGRAEHNERLEFFGDAVLELIVSEYLFDRYPEKQEGELTQLRTTLVNTTTLAVVAEALGLGDFLLLSRGQAKDNGRAMKFILAGAYEAVIGAIYRDRGLEAANDFVKRTLLPYFTNILGSAPQRDAKSLFQEEAQARVNITPTYQVLRESGSDHAKHFTMGAYLGSELVAEGEGPSKREAERQAADAALKVKGWGA